MTQRERTVWLRCHDSLFIHMKTCTVLKIILRDDLSLTFNDRKRKAIACTLVFKQAAIKAVAKRKCRRMYVASLLSDYEN